MKKTLYSLLISGILCSLSAFMATAKEDANVRANPSIKSDVVGVLIQGEDIEVIEKVNPNYWPWYKTPRGYVSSNLLEPKHPVISNNKNHQSANTPKPVLRDKTNVTVTNKAENPLEIALKQEEIKVEATLQEDINIPVPQKENLKELSENDNKYNYFIGVGLNYNILSVNQEDKVGTILLNKQPEDTASSTNIQIGAYIQNYAFSLNYEMLNLDAVKIDTTYLSLDYTFNNNFLNPFIGASLGMSNLVWQTDPLVNSKTKDSKLSSVMYGVQTGIHYQVYLNWSVYGILSYQKFDFRTSFISLPAKADLTHEDKKSLGAGVRYSF